MPRDGALTLSDIRSPWLGVWCKPCARRGRYAVAQLLAKHGDARLAELLSQLTGFEKAGVYAPCQARYDFAGASGGSAPAPGAGIRNPSGNRPLEIATVRIAIGGGLWSFASPMPPFWVRSIEEGDYCLDGFAFRASSINPPNRASTKSASTIRSWIKVSSSSLAVGAG